MKGKIQPYVLTGLCLLLAACNTQKMNFKQYPSAVIANGEIRMQIYLPDAEKGLYRATRFDWSGIIGSVRYKGHEYFGYWKETHDPLVHEDLTGPVEGFIEPGLGYEEAKPGEAFLRIGVGALEKEEETKYGWTKTYNILDHGQWTIDRGENWIKFVHEIQSDLGYGYRYEKTIRLKTDGFVIEHRLQNTGRKPIETDQFNHNFFVIDGQKSGPAFQIRFPYEISTDRDTKGLVEIDGKNINFLQELDNNSVFLELNGFGQEATDHQATVLNQRSGAGVTFTVDKPLYRRAFCACETTLSPENFIWLSVAPGAEERWVSDYTLFVEEGKP